MEIDSTDQSKPEATPTFEEAQASQPTQVSEPRPQGWTYWDVVVVTGFAIGAQMFVYVAGVIALLLIGQARGGTATLFDGMTRVSFVLPVQILWWALVFWVIYRVVRARDPRPFRLAIGWVRPARPIGVYLSGGAFLALSVAVFAWALPSPRKHMPMEQLFRDPFSASVLAVFGVSIAPVIEELLFRGFLYPVVARAHGAAVAVVGTALLFSVVHAPQYGWAWQNLLLLTYVGVAFGTIRAVSGTLVPSTLVHAAYNFTLFVGLFAASDRFRHLNF